MTRAAVDHLGSDRAEAARHGRLLDRLGYRGLTALAVFMVGIGWGALAIRFPGSVIAPATIVPAVQPVPVIHVSGGAVEAIAVREGQRVQAGDRLLRFEDTAARATLAVVERQLDEARVLIARLTAESAGRDRLTFDEALLERARQSPDLGRLVASEIRLFQTRLEARRNAGGQIEQRIVQMASQIDALKGLRVARERELAITAAELDGVRPLYQRGLVPITRFAVLERSAASLTGQIGQIATQMSQLASRIAEARLELLQIDETRRKDTLGELREAETRMFEIAERHARARDQLDRTTVTASVAGVVHRLAAHGPGVVVGPGETVLQIVPDSVPLRAQLRIEPRDIDLVQVGQPVRLSLHQAAGQTRHSLAGRVVRVAPDVSREAASGHLAYSAQVELDEAAWQAGTGAALRAGMVGEAFVHHDSRTLAGYIMAPILQQFGAR